MKGKLFFTVLLVTMIASCAPGANSHLEDHLMAYNWKITYMKSNNVDVTSMFNPYIFNFEGNSVILAIRPDSTFQGTWSRSNTSQSNPKIVINFGSHYQLSKLNFDWQQDARTDNVIELVDEMSANSSESVTFTRL